ncbi:MAG: DUF1016 N-terminal domain-containing protein [Prevotella sp.]|nr:DUF1016 N-terminal domain-containing protein [Prevotella sp.]
MVYTYYGVGQYIVEDEQQGEQRAQYGQTVLKNLSARLTNKYGQGWSVETLKKCRFFYLTYREEMIGSTVWTQLDGLPIVKEADVNISNYDRKAT